MSDNLKTNTKDLILINERILVYSTSSPTKVSRNRRLQPRERIGCRLKGRNKDRCLMYLPVAERPDKNWSNLMITVGSMEDLELAISVSP